MINVSVCTPSVGQMKTRYCTSFARMMVHYQQNAPLGREYDVRRLSYHIIESSMVGQARETFVEEFLARKNSTHLLFIDEDMGFREDVLNILLMRQMPFVSCNYRMKVPPCPFTSRKPDDSGWIETKKESISLEETLFNGFGFSLIERQVLEATSSPRFMNEWLNNAYSTEDRSFCLKARAAGFPPMIDHIASKRVYHIGTYNYSWDDDFPPEKAVPIAERS